MSNVVLQFRDRHRSNVSTPIVLWAIGMAVILFLAIVAPSTSVTLSGFGISALLGIYLGWRRRIGAVVIAPFVSWLFAWFPMEVASMIHFGIVKGFFFGIFFITLGWIGIGFVEFASLALVALVVRALRGSSHDDAVIIIDPENL